MKKIRTIIWRILGVDFTMLLNKMDFVLLKNDPFTIKGIGTYDNGAKVWRWTEATLVIGKYCSIANNVNFIVDEGHHTIAPVCNYPIADNLFKNDSSINGMDKSVFFDQFEQKSGITIGNDVWIGMGAYIMSGVKVGNGAIIAANSVVTKDVPDYAVVGGVPAKLIRMKYSDDIIESLNKISWWDWDQQLLKERINDFYLPIQDFVKKRK